MTFYPTFLSGFVKVQANLGDTRFNNYVLEHTYRWLLQEQTHQSFWDMPIFYPMTNTAAYSDILLGVAPLYWVFRVLTFEADTAFQLWMIAVLVLNFVVAYGLLRRGFSVSSVAASLGAFLFTFASTRIAQLDHQQLLSQFYSLIAIYALLRIFHSEEGKHRKRDRLWIAVFFACISLQFYAGFYLGWFLIFSLGVAALWVVVLPGFRRVAIPQLIRHFSWIGIWGALCLLSLLPMAFHYLEIARELGYREFGHVHTLIPRAQAWFYMGPWNWLYGWMASLPLFKSILLEQEMRLGVGFFSPVVCALGLWWGRKNGRVMLLLLSGLTIVALCTAVADGFTLWKWVYLSVPGAGAVRGVSRIAIMVVIPASVGFALFFEKFLSRSSKMPRKQLLFVALLAVFCILEQGQRSEAYNKRLARLTTERIGDQILEHQPQCQAFFYSQFHGRYPEWKYHVDAMWVQLYTGIPTVNGHSGNVPMGWTFGKTKIQSWDDEKVLAKMMNDWGTKHQIPPENICWVRRYRAKGDVIDVRPCCTTLAEIKGARKVG